MEIEVGGLTARPTFLPSDLIFQSSGVTASPSSTWMFIWLAPAWANGSSRISGFEHIRCTSKNSFVSGRIVRTTAGPNEMFGTKCPSMMSRCSQSAPEALTRATSRASRPKFAANSEGAIIMRIR